MKCLNAAKKFELNSQLLGYCNITDVSCPREDNPETDMAFAQAPEGQSETELSPDGAGEDDETNTESPPDDAAEEDPNDTQSPIKPFCDRGGIRYYVLDGCRKFRMEWISLGLQYGIQDVADGTLFDVRLCGLNHAADTVCAV